MKILQERHGVTNSGFASVLLLVLATLWITTTVFSAKVESAEKQTLVSASSTNASPSNSVVSAAVKPALRDCAAAC